MHPRLLEYYNQELAHVREMGAEFAAEFPKVAARLGMEGMEVADPYVERLLEGFAFVAARTQLKIDAEFPRFTQHLLEILAPHYLRPLPSMMIVQLPPKRGDPSLATGCRIERGSMLRSALVRGQQTACQFVTAHALTLWPIELTGVSYFSHANDLPLAKLGLAETIRGGLRLPLQCHEGVEPARLPCDALDFHLTGVDDIAGPLYELVQAKTLAIGVFDPVAKTWLGRLPADAIGEIGFADDESLLPSDRRTFSGYRLLREYFAFPDRFRFFRVSGLQRLLNRARSGRFELVLLFGAAESRLEGAVGEQAVVMNATPVINIFARRADRILLDESRFEHHLVVDRTRPLDFEVHSVTSLRGLGENMQRETEFAPFFGHTAHDAGRGHQAFYTLRRMPRLTSERERRAGARSGYTGTEVFVSLVDPAQAPYSLSLRQLAPEVLATNRDLPLLLPVGQPGVLMLEQARAVGQIQILKGPTRPRAGLMDGEHAWRLVSHLSLNYLSLIGSADAAESGAVDPDAVRALREMLLLYAAPEDAAQRRWVESLSGLSCKPVVRRVPGAGPITFGRGLAIEIEVDESAFGGAGAFLFGSVLEKFLARHASMNTFTETRLRSVSRGEVARWPARMGTRIVA